MPPEPFGGLDARLDVQYAEPPPPGDPRYGLDHIGRDYACLVARPHTAALCRLIITELRQKPDLFYGLGVEGYTDYPFLEAA